MAEKRRTAFVLFEIEGYSGEEIAELFGIPVATVWTRLHHARKDYFRLVDAYQRNGGGR
jgi:RNA polymerase sigma-70 factor (ECF subfamily)